MKLTKAELNHIRHEKHVHIVLTGGFVLIISAILFGLEMLGLGTATGVIGTIFMVIADL